jgi:aspartyl-tRNA(Asn)/glutamyl-tRNA(Gln) amidotransferase subunit B
VIPTGLGMDYDITIGFETHVELKTETKLFCDCAVSYDAPPNTSICPVCTGQPGALPVLNKRALQFTVRAGLALNCEINRRCRFARKNYFYPDLPKGYQISQYELPVCRNGYLEVAGGDGQPLAVGIKRVHLEEDAGKLLHSSSSLEGTKYSLVDYNRASVPLLEIVTDHERNPVRSIQEARAYLEKLRQVLKYIEISDCIIEKGQFRCDVNVSLRPKGSRAYGNRAEVKNMASFRFIMDALEYEVKRQSDILESGDEVLQETRLFDEQRKITLPMRSKEDAPDYRYFPDPDLVEIELDHDFVNKIRKRMPELPDQKVARLMEAYGIPKSDVLILTKERGVSEYFTACAEICEDRKKLSRWIIKELFKLLNKDCVSIEKCPVNPDDFSRLIDLVSVGEITEKMGRAVLEEMFERRVGPDAIITEKGLEPIHDIHALEEFVDAVLEEHPEVVAKVKQGDRKPVDYLIGQVMRKTHGKAKPMEVGELVKKKILGAVTNDK